MPQVLDGCVPVGLHRCGYCSEEKFRLEEHNLNLSKMGRNEAKGIRPPSRLPNALLQGHRDATARFGYSLRANWGSGCRQHS